MTRIYGINELGRSANGVQHPRRFYKFCTHYAAAPKGYLYMAPDPKKPGEMAVLFVNQKTQVKVTRRLRNIKSLAELPDLITDNAPLFIRRKRSAFSDPIDAQRKRLYNWENVKFHHVECEQTYETLRDLLDTMTSHMEWNKEVKLKCRKGGNTSWAKYHSWEISLAGSMNKKWVLIHEFAHFVANWVSSRRGTKFASHGPEFLGIYMYLLVEYYGQNLKELQNSATMAGLSFVPFRVDLALAA